MSGKSSHGLMLRIASALVLAPLVLFCIIYGGWPFLLMAGIAIGISMKEWTGMAKLSSRPLVNGIGGIFYILACFATFVYLRQHHSDYGVALTLSLMLCVWSTDTGAYFSGKAIGGPKMAPSISPNKTWAGLVGGVASSIAVLFVYQKFLGPFLAGKISGNYTLPEGFTTEIIVIAGVIIAITDQIGDLLISMEKRKVGVKDTGALIPGHGGLLDRIDGLLLASAAFVICLKVFGL